MFVTRVLLLPAMLAAISSLQLGDARAASLQPPEVRPAQVSYAVTPEGALRRPLARGIYQVVYSKAQDALYVASSESIPNVQGGVIYRLDPRTLETTGLIHTDEKNFGLALDPAGETLFVTHSLGAAVSRIDLKKGKVTGRIVFQERSFDDTPYGPRTVVFDAQDGLLYVGGVGDPGRIWVIDPQTFTVRASIGDAGKWVTGLVRDPGSNRLFAANGGGEVLVIDTQTHQITQRWKPAGDEAALLVNLALDAAGQRLFVTDNARLKTVLVLDAKSGKVSQRLPVGESMDVLYQPERNALYLTHRNRGTVSVLDATGFSQQAQYTLPPHPNSLTLSPDGRALYVTIKTPFTPAPRVASGEGSIARIDLQ